MSYFSDFFVILKVCPNTTLFGQHLKGFLYIILDMRYSEVTPYNNMEQLFKQSPEPNFTIISMGLYYTGARIGELLQVKQEDVTINKDDPTFIQVKLLTEKNPHSPYRFIPISLEKEPLAERVFFQDKQPNDLLFPKYNPNIKFNSFMRVIRRKFNFFFNVAPHYFRHCRLTHCITEFDFNDQELVKYAGWTDSKPAKWYVSLKTTDLQRKMRDKK